MDLIVNKESESGVAMNRSELTDSIVEGCKTSSSGDKPSPSSIWRMKKRILCQPGARKRRRVRYKTVTRYIAEHSDRSSIAYALTVAATHWFAGTPVNGLHADLENLPDKAKKMYELVKKIHGHEDLVHVLPKLLTSTDETTIYVTSEKVENELNWYLVFTKPGDDEETSNNSEDSKHRSYFATTPCDDNDSSGFRMRINTTMNADGQIAPGFIVVSGLTAEQLPGASDIQYAELDHLGGKFPGRKGYVVFVRKRSETSDSNTLDDDYIPREKEIMKLYREKVYRPWIQDIRQFEYGWNPDTEIPEYLRAVSWQDGAGGR